MISYKTLDDFEPGIIQEIIKSSYQELIISFPREKLKLYRKWEYEDFQAFHNKGIMKNYILFTCLNDKPIGYFSWDDRQFPIGIIGQNCVFPEYRRRGYGTEQIKKITKIFSGNKFTQIRVSTGDHNFFMPAQKMYLKNNFEILEKQEGELFDLLILSKKLT